MMNARPRISVLGAGSWGTALAISLSQLHSKIQLYCRDEIRASRMETYRQNADFLPDVHLPEAISVTADLEQATQDTNVLVLAVPSNGFFDVIDQIERLGNLPGYWVIATKGLASKDGEYFSEALANRFGQTVKMAVLSGPSFAKEVARNMPTAVVLASDLETTVHTLKALWHHSNFRVYGSLDMKGVQLCGAIKNAIAIACGISDGVGFGSNATAALITRGLAELKRLGLVFGANPHTFLGLAGVGDMVLTCSDNQSRNRRFGTFIGGGERIDQAMESVGQVVEGYYSVHDLYHLSQSHQVDMPIVAATYKVLYEGMTAVDAIESLLSRDPKLEDA